MGEREKTERKGVRQTSENQLAAGDALGRVDQEQSVPPSEYLGPSSSGQLPYRHCLVLGMIQNFW